MKRDILGVALAGGRSSRMGEDKAKLAFHEEGNQLDYTLSLLDKFCKRLAVSGRSSQKGERASRLPAVFVSDVPNVDGPMAGVIASLIEAGGDPVLAVACDMPLLEASVLLMLVSRRDPSKLATCFVGKDGKPDPMCSIYESSSLEVLEKDAREGRLSLRRFLQGDCIERIAFDRPDLLASVNTPEEADAARRHLNSN